MNPDFNAVDIICLVCLGSGTCIGLYRKLSGELARLLGAFIVFFLTALFYRRAALWLAVNTRLSEKPDVATALSYLLVAIAVLICMLVVRLVLRRIMQVTFNKKIDLAGGAVAGFLKSAIIIIIVLTAVGMWPNPWLERLVKKESFTGKFVFENIVPRFETRYQHETGTSQDLSI